MTTYRRWTRHDRAVLRDQWSETTLVALARKLDRTRAAVYQQARLLGLELGCPNGMEYLWYAANREGYSIAGLRTILDRSGVPICRSMSRPTRGKKVRPRHYVDPFLVDEAVSAWCAQETLKEAATRRGLCDKVLAKRLSGVADVPKKPARRRHWRIPTEIIDRALREAT